MPDFLLQVLQERASDFQTDIGTVLQSFCLLIVRVLHRRTTKIKPQTAGARMDGLIAFLHYWPGTDPSTREVFLMLARFLNRIFQLDGSVTRRRLHQLLKLHALPD
ncbi:unnamed protein product [Coffea canephora]|uniref:Uncharacterized protein n=1 Tax=Coffea canephora TaxID=49390 RepID=A0A068UWY8_COFCA|nr:unnamed protein product [Coffea canephora]